MSQCNMRYAVQYRQLRRTHCCTHRFAYLSACDSELLGEREAVREGRPKSREETPKMGKRLQ
jgi:hypothetical protein